MPDSCGTIEERMKRLLRDPYNEELLSDLLADLKKLDERDRCINDTLESLLKEVDDLLLQVDQRDEEDCEG